MKFVLKNSFRIMIEGILKSTPFSKAYSLLYWEKIGPIQNFFNFKSLNLTLNNIPTANFVSKNAFRMVS